MGTNFPDICIKNGINFNNFGIRNGTDLQELKVVSLFRKFVLGTGMLLKPMLEPSLKIYSISTLLDTKTTAALWAATDLPSDIAGN